MVNSAGIAVANTEGAEGTAHVVASALFAHLCSNAGTTNLCKMDL